jgi:cell filamentation protein
VAARSYELSQTPLKGRFDLAHLQAIHKYLFSDLYEWAGQFEPSTSAEAATASPITRGSKAQQCRSSNSSQKKTTSPDLDLRLSATAPRITSAS